MRSLAPITRAYAWADKAVAASAPPVVCKKLRRET
jgi:hypothetical protein